MKYFLHILILTGLTFNCSFSQTINAEYNQFITKYFQMKNKYNQGYIDYISENEYIINFLVMQRNL